MSKFHLDDSLLMGKIYSKSLSFLNMLVLAIFGDPRLLMSVFLSLVHVFDILPCFCIILAVYANFLFFVVGR